MDVTRDYERFHHHVFYTYAEICSIAQVFLVENTGCNLPI